MKLSILNFRSRLLLAMAFVVCIATIGTLLVTQRRVQESYERMFRRQFDRQVDYFVTLQESRLANVRDQCLKLAATDRLIDLLRQTNVDSSALYQFAATEMREVIADLGVEGRASNNPRNRRPQNGFLRFIDANADPIPPPNARGRFTAPALRRRPHPTPVQEALSNAAPQQVGYMIVGQDSPRPGGPRAPVVDEPRDNPEASTPQEMILTKVTDPATRKLLGALIVGFPLPDVVPQIKTNSTATRAIEPIQSGLLLSNRLYGVSGGLPESAAQQLAADISGRINAADREQGDFTLQVLGAPYRVFYDVLNKDSIFPPAYQVCLYPLAEVATDVQNVRREILTAGAVALLIALILSLAIAHGLSGPVRDLVRGTEEVQAGNFDIRVPVRSRDEMGQLAASFNEMAEGLAQKERYRTILNMVADEQIARKLLEGQISLGGELRDVTVLFCDIRGFTRLTQGMPPADVIEMLNEHMSALTAVVKQYNGVLDKFVGDLFMVLFGAPLNHEDDVLDAARCALAIVAERNHLNEISRHKLQIGIGIATGKAVAGCMGSRERLNYTVLGERVNLASRLCDRAGAGEVLIDQTTQERLDGRITVQALPPQELDGFSAAVPVYRLVSLTSPQARPAT